MVFQLPDGFGEEDARDLCARFAAEPSSESAICPMAGVEIKTSLGEGEVHLPLCHQTMEDALFSFGDFPILKLQF